MESLTEFVKDRPDATAQGARCWLHRVTMEMERWTIGQSRLGGVRLPRHTGDHLTWFRRVQLVLNAPAGPPAVSREIAEEIASTESDLHTALKQQTWIFGGRYVKGLARRRLATLDEIDIPLLRGDGSLHVIELKRAAVPNLVEKPRSHCAVGPDVHRAVAQAANDLPRNPF
ncbi:Shedu anti-phage system protein SduA domain-containing protein [Actinophytocola sp.]|uniref:Shedu anti-phage system protein SduA domain-containing protein n=1 Tax=Actinophytocola sp. TaxID=1872138 RepID=UPI002DDD04C2|nr:Shedu anti-phage system protein SduA domain-containing protein [Actinophytocola sp.]